MYENWSCETLPYEAGMIFQTVALFVQTRESVGNALRQSTSTRAPVGYLLRVLLEKGGEYVMYPQESSTWILAGRAFEDRIELKVMFYDWLPELPKRLLKIVDSKIVDLQMLARDDDGSLWI